VSGAGRKTADAFVRPDGVTFTTDDNGGLDIVRFNGRPRVRARRR